MSISRAFRNIKANYGYPNRCVKCDKHIRHHQCSTEKKAEGYVLYLCENPSYHSFTFLVCHECIIQVPADLEYIENEQYALYSPQKRQVLCSKDVDGEHIDLYIYSGGSYWLPMGG
jgi:hypothetical protein